MIPQKITLFFSMFLGAAALFFAGCNSNSGSASTDVSLDTTIDSVSYSLGYQIASMSLKPQGMTDVDADKFATGLKNALEDNESALSQLEMQQLMKTCQMLVQKKDNEKT